MRTTTTSSSSFPLHLMAVRGGADEAQQQQQQQEEEEGSEESSNLPNALSAVLTTEESPLEESTESDAEEPPNVYDGDDDESRMMTLAFERAQQLRQAGKDLHDRGDWEQAAVSFQRASLLLEEWGPLLLEEYATCRLHEALCFLKQKDYAECIEACTAVLEREPPAAIRARALHRRSRAKLGLGLEDGALQDARSAAFLGDRKAVALYGKLMRHDSSSSDPSLQDMFQGGNPFMATAGAGAGAGAAGATGDLSSKSSSGLLESLLNKSSSNRSAASPLSMLMNGNNEGGGGLAKSVLSSLSKQVENESTQENICRYLQNANEAQVQQLAAMAGVPLSQGYASRLVSFCHGITPKGIRKSVKTTKRVWYGISLIRKTLQTLSKYRHFLILWVLIAWIKSSMQRPIPINKKAAQFAMKQALNQGAI
jgi:tetratricopeptide (TPR) repeat protein